MKKLIILVMSIVIFNSCSATEDFSTLENKIGKEVKSAKSDTDKLTEAFKKFHNIRSYEAMKELWQQFNWQKENINILYVGSGSHIAPLVFLEAPGKVKNFTFNYTEIDLNSIENLDDMINYLVKQQGYTEFTSRFIVAAYGSERVFKSIDEFREHISSIKWSRSQYSFKKGDISVKVDLKVNYPLNSKIDPPFCTLKALKQADLFISHDWDSSPQKNLGVAYSVISSLQKSIATSCPAIMMEDLGQYPFPIDMTFLNPFASSSKPYGHATYSHLPDGTKLTWERGKSLYGGAILLEPEQKYFNTISELELKAVFDLAIFSDFLFNRLNVDYVEGELLSAPPLLDLATNYGYRDIMGYYIKEKPDFLPATVASCIQLVKNKSPLSAYISKKLTALKIAIEKELQKKPESIKEWKNLTEDQQKFLDHVGQQQMFKDIVKDMDSQITVKTEERKTLVTIKTMIDDFFKACSEKAE